mmetsp:Transcript_15972/g.43934  ORF Transcript_15972/g.43934 Transcript_15972/m.43934 type:complete len:207 (+) Transcript_15972:138-758(+)
MELCGPICRLRAAAPPRRSWSGGFAPKPTNCSGRAARETVLGPLAGQFKSRRRTHRSTKHEGAIGQPRESGRKGGVLGTRRSLCSPGAAACPQPSAPRSGSSALISSAGAGGRRGNQLRRPSGAMRAGVTTARIRKVSTSTAVISCMPRTFRAGTLEMTSPEKAMVIMRPAAVITRPLLSTPSAMASLSPKPRSRISTMRPSRNTS